MICLPVGRTGLAARVFADLVLGSSAPGTMSKRVLPGGIEIDPSPSG
jgi:hypothetical protein